ncbi:hypothetical protein ACFX12_026864 [Malus domestica]
MWYLALEIRRTILLRFLRKQSCLPCHEAQRLTHRDFPIIQQWYCSFTLVERCSGSCKLHVLNFGRDFDKVICEVFDRMPIISAKLSVRVTGADKARKEGASSISEIGPRGL